MLIGLCGGLCAGKREVARYLVDYHKFESIILNSGQTSDKTDDINVISFDSAPELLDYVTPKWYQRFVLTDVRDEAVLDQLSNRPFFILISVDAPVHIRWMRYLKRIEALKGPPPSLEDFLRASDHQMYDRRSGISRIVDRATLKLINPDTTIDALHTHLSSLNLTDVERLRPGWDAYFMQLAALAAKRSNCMKRRVGCVLIREKRVIATGYNGTPRGLKNCNDGGCQRCNSGSAGGTALATCLCLHAEENALLEAGRERVGVGATLYCDTCPCLTCSIKIVQVGISEVVYARAYSMDDQTAAVFKEGGVNLRQYTPPRDGLVSLIE